MNVNKYVHKYVCLTSLWNWHPGGSKPGLRESPSPKPCAPSPKKGGLSDTSRSTSPRAKKTRGSNREATGATGNY